MRRWFRHPEPEDIVPYNAHEYSRQWHAADRRIYLVQMLTAVGLTLIAAGLFTLGLIKLLEILPLL